MVIFDNHAETEVCKLKTGQKKQLFTV